MTNPDWWAAAESEIDDIIGGFTTKLRGKLEVSPSRILARKNPFLFRIRAGSDFGADSLAQMVIEAYMSSSEETIFGNAIEDIAVAMCRHAKGGRKSAVGNIDLEYDVGNTRTIVQIKSGVNWGNSSQKQALLRSFSTATRILRQGNQDLNIRCVEGCSYGRSESKDLGTHYRIVGDKFWEDISDWNGASRAVIGVLGRHAGNGLGESKSEARSNMVEYLRGEGVVGEDGQIRWDELLGLVNRPRRRSKAAKGA